MWDRAVSVRFGLSTVVSAATPQASGFLRYVRDTGPRMVLTALRTIRSEPDSATLRLYNLPSSVIDALRTDVSEMRSQIFALQSQSQKSLDDKTRAQRLHATLEGYIVEVYAGYGDDPPLIFRGDPVHVRPRVREGTDYYTELELGDGFVALREQHMAASLGVGATPENVLRLALELSGVASSRKIDKAITGMVVPIVPNAVFTRLRNGYVMVGRPANIIDEIADVLDLQWWVRDGELVFTRRGEVVTDFSLDLHENNCIDLDRPDDFEDLRARVRLSALAAPGRACVVTYADGATFHGRCYRVDHMLDTHGDNWHSEIYAQAVTNSRVADLLRLPATSFEVP